VHTGRHDSRSLGDRRACCRKEGEAVSGMQLYQGDFNEVELWQRVFKHCINGLSLPCGVCRKYRRLWHNGMERGRDHESVFECASDNCVYSSSVLLTHVGLLTSQLKPVSCWTCDRATLHQETTCGFS
jgi:hypothetical protein